MDLATFRNTLLGVMESNNEVRKQAEENYESVPVINRMSLLLQLLCSNDEARVHQQSAILLRRLITANFSSSFMSLNHDEQTQFKTQLLACIGDKSEQFVRKRIADCVSELARRIMDDEQKGTWPEVLEFMFKSVSSQEDSLKEIPLYIFNQYPGIFGSQQEHYKDIIHQMLSKCLQDSETKNVRFAASCALMSFLLENVDNNQYLRKFSDLVPMMLKACNESADEDNDAVLKGLCELCEEAPKVIRPHLTVAMQLFHLLISNHNREDSIRQLALECVITLAETAPAMVRKQKTGIPMMVEQMLALMVDLEDGDEALIEWSVADESNEDDDEEANHVIGENSIDRFACALGGKIVLPEVMKHVPQMLNNEEWRYRHAGLMAISAIGEGCHKHMEASLKDIVEKIVPYLKDSHPRVRYAACNCIGQMCTDFAPIMQKNHHERLVQALYETLDDAKNPRVQAHAGAALVNFVEDCPTAIILPYLEPLCNKLELVLTQRIQNLGETGSKLVLEQVTTTIAAVADSAEKQFTVFYDRFMPTLKMIMQQAKAQEFRMLRGKTIECISLIGLAVGSEKFMPDAQDIMNHLLQTQADTNSWEDDDPQISYMISAWARMCKLLGEKFVEYLPVVMSPLLKAASVRPEVTMLDTHDVGGVDEDDGWEFIKLGDQQSFGIKTAGLEEKATACQMLVCYAKELKTAFAEYVPQVVKLMVPLLKFYFHDGVRASAAESLPLLLTSAQVKGEEHVKDIWDYIAPNLLQAIADEPVSDTQSVEMESLARCIEIRGMGCFTMEKYEELANTLKKMLEDHFLKAEQRFQQRNDEDYDEHVEEKLIQEDSDDCYILSKISDILHALFYTHKSELFPFFESLLPYYSKLLVPERPWADRQWSMCVFDDIIEHCGADALKYKDVFVQHMLNYINDESPEVRQAASYGVGVMAISAPQEFAQVIQEAIPRLEQAIIGPYGNQNGQRVVPQEELAPLDNCVSAICKILKHAPQLLGDQREQLLSTWLSWLPVTEDKEEAAHVYSFLCDLIESNDPMILGSNNSNLPAVISLIADAAYGQSFEMCPEVAKRLVNICKSVQQNASDVWTSSIKNLPTPKQMALGMFMEG